MSNVFYDATYAVFFSWLGFGMRELFATIMAASVVAAGLLWWCVALVRRTGVVRAGSIAITLLSAACALVATAAAYQLFDFPVTHTLNSYVGVGVVLAATATLTLVTVVISVWFIVAAGHPHRTTSLLRFAGPARFLAGGLAFICVVLVGWSWADVLNLVAEGRAAAAAAAGR